ncbi:MAG: UDP-N-acetylmuramoyl-tripeptide-D-alanyl-D-alanine ligase, partial [Candidatus Nomurabacteria bacterium GW2011_GWA1_40_8]
MKTSFKKIITYILRVESQLVLYKYKPKIIAITGSLGKTSTKDAVYAVLSKVAYVRKSEKSFSWLENIFKGLWLFLWSHKYPEWLVLEVGVGKPDDIKKTASWLSTDAVIITAIGETPPHIEFFSSHKHLVEEKSQLIKTLKSDGILVLNADDQIVLEMKAKTKCRTITYGFGEGADILGSDDKILFNDKNIPEGVIFRVDEKGSSLPVVIEGVFGRNHI